MKTLTIKTSANMLMSILFASLIFISCSKEEHDTSMQIPDNTGYSKSLSEAEKAGLIYMAEQQKLLQNIYQVMHERHGSFNYEQLASSKQQQTLLLSAKIDKYELTSPLTDMESGEFVNPLLQEAYNEFIGMENMDLTDCIIFSKTMEEAVIADLEVLITEVKGNDDLVKTYNNILTSSQADLQGLFQEAKNFIDLALWYDPIKIFEPPTSNLRYISVAWNPVKDF